MFGLKNEADQRFKFALHGFGKDLSWIFWAYMINAQLQSFPEKETWKVKNDWKHSCLISLQQNRASLFSNIKTVAKLNVPWLQNRSQACWVMFKEDIHIANLYTKVPTSDFVDTKNHNLTLPIVWEIRVFKLLSYKPCSNVARVQFEVEYDSTVCGN